MSPRAPTAFPAAPICAAALLALLACSTKKTEPTPTAASADVKPSGKVMQQRAPGTQRPRPTPPKPTKRKVSAKPVEAVKVSEDDPVKGKWTLEDATKGLPPGDVLWATIETDHGRLDCRLFHDKAPITVANFVGLARGVRPWRTPEGKWEKRPAYDGTVFHRVIKGFMIQGGDAKRTGTGEAGYVIPDEVWEDANHDRAGLLCMANRGPNTGSAQFFITDDSALHLDGGYTIFGECSPLELVHTLASVDIERGDRPKTPPAIARVTIGRRAGEAAPSASASAGPAASGSAAASAGPAPKKAAAPKPAASPKPIE